MDWVVLSNVAWVFFGSCKGVKTVDCAKQDRAMVSIVSRGRAWVKWSYAFVSMGRRIVFEPSRG
jgi:hypothetical protein